MITLTLEMDFPEDRNAEILEKLSALLNKNNKVKVKELRIGDNTYPLQQYPIINTNPYTPLTTWTNLSSTRGDTIDWGKVMCDSETSNSLSITLSTEKSTSEAFINSLGTSLNSED